MPEIHPEYGYIIGGGCDKAHRERVQREHGILSALEHYVDRGLIRVSGRGWWKLIRWRRTTHFRVTENLANGYPAGAKTRPQSTAGRAIGFYRFEQELVPAILRRGKSFRMSQLRNWCACVAACEFGMDGETPLGPWQHGFTKPHHDGMFQKRLAGGDLQSPLADAKVQVTFETTDADWMDPR